MECYWKTILLLLAVIIQSLPGSTQTPAPFSTVSQATDSPPTLETSTAASSTTESTPTTTTSSVATDTTPKQITVSINSSNNFVPSSTSSETTTTSTSPTSTAIETSASSANSTSTSAATNDSTSSTLTPANTPAIDTPPSALTTTSTPPSPPATSNIAPSALTTANTSPPTLTPNNSSSTTAATSMETTPATPSLGILISETNLLLTNDSSKYFVEIQVSKNVHTDSVWLVIQNASTDGAEGLLLNDHINISSIDNDLYVYKNFTAFSDKLTGLDSVLIALYSDDVSAGNLTIKGLHDILLYSSSGNISPGLKESFANIFSQNLIIDYEKFNITVPFSLSRCSEHVIANSAAVLTTESPGQNNVCNFTFRAPLQMKLTKKNQSCSQYNSPTDFKSALINCVISYVNEEERCGLTVYMMTAMEVTQVCNISDATGLDVKFTVNSTFKDQGTLIMKGYMDLLRQQMLTIKGENYYLTNCFDWTTPPTSTDDNRIRVTVAVVVSCIGVFLLVLLCVVLYLRRKRKGILQFHMTRLDEDDDLAGDMDDFVGNQGATFRNYR